MEVFTSEVRRDSGCGVAGVAVGGRRWFVKVPLEPAAEPPLRRAVALHAAVRHPAVIRLAGTMSTGFGPALVYPWLDGVEVRSARDRFLALPLSERLAALDSIFDAHLVVAAAGFVAVDLYDGCFLYDFAARRMWLCDLDEYRPGPFRVEGDRLPGSTRFMAPEEFVRGAVIDERTTVFNLGRTAQVLLAGRRSAALDRATDPEPGRRYPTVSEFVAAWRDLTVEHMFV